MTEKEESPSAPRSEGPNPAAEEEYVFCFRLDPSPADPRGYDDPVLELVRGQLADLLDAVQLTYHGQTVKVDGFRLIQDPDTQYEVFPRRKPAEE